MNIVIAIALVLSCADAVKTGLAFMTARDEFMKSGETDYPKNLVTLRRKFLRTLVFFIVFILLLILDL